MNTKKKILVLYLNLTLYLLYMEYFFFNGTQYSRTDSSIGTQLVICG